MPSPTFFMAVGIGLAVILVSGLTWHFLRSKRETKPSEPPSTTAASEPATSAEPAPEGGSPESGEAEEEPPVQPAPAPEANPQAEEITRLQNLARASYIKGNYAEPRKANAIAYSKRVLAMDPTDNYTKTLLENSVKGGKYQVQQALRRKDYTTARRVANALAQLLPNRKDIAGLQEDIASAQRGGRPAGTKATPLVSFQVYHLHATKAPSDKGAFCLGNMSVTAQHIKFAGVSASDRHVHNFDIPCSAVREIRKNSRVASKQGGFHVRTRSTNYNFAPQNPAALLAPALESACKQ